MIANQIDVNGNIIVEEEPKSPSPKRIREILLNSLNDNGYSFTWTESKNKPYIGILTDGEESILLYIYVWRISNGGKGRPKGHLEKRIQIGKYHDEIGFYRPITNNVKSVLIGIYERDIDNPIICAWDIISNRGHGSSKSCFTTSDVIAKTVISGFEKSEDSDGNIVYSFKPEFLTSYIELLNKEADIGVIETKETALADDVKGSTRRKRKQIELIDIENLQTKIEKMERTYRETVVNVRVGQGYFKEMLIKKYNNKCCICGLEQERLLIGSHIKEWSKSNDKEKMDLSNGLLLCSLHDALFDKHFISFDDNGSILISDKLSEQDVEILKLSNNYKIEINEDMKKYLEWHRRKML